MSAAAADVFTSFEFVATGPFTDPTWASPYTATFSTGNAETRGIPQFYISGANSWHVLVNTTAAVTFETLPNTLSFFVRTENATDDATVRVLDTTGADVIMPLVATTMFQQINIDLNPGDALIETVLIESAAGGNITGGDAVIDDLTFGYSGFGFAGATDDIDCAVAETLEFFCVLTNTGNAVATVGGTVQVMNNTEVSGSGTLYAVPGSTLADGSTFASVTISAGTVSTANTLDVTVEAAGTTSTITTTYDTIIYERASDFATIAAAYQTFDIFGEASSFVIDAAGVISGQSANCVLAGQVTIINAAFNVYDVSVDVTDTAACAVGTGTYNGLGLSADDMVMDDAFIFGAFTTDMAIAGQAVK